MKDMKQICQQVPVIPVLVVERVEDAKPMAAALVKGGLHVLEVTLRTPAALDAIRAMSEVEGSVVGAGTVLTAEDVVAVKHMQKVLEEDNTEYTELNINGDKAAVLFRRKTLEWVLEEYPELATS